MNVDDIHNQQKKQRKQVQIQVEKANQSLASEEASIPSQLASPLNTDKGHLSVGWKQDILDRETGLPNKFFDKLQEEPLDLPNNQKQNKESKSLERGKKLSSLDNKQPQFNPSSYKFKKPDYNYKQEIYKQRFFDNLEANRSQINKQLVELCYHQILSRMKKQGEEAFPAHFYENKIKWAGLLMRSKKLQGVFSTFTEKIAYVLEDELNGNKDLISAYVKYPHKARAKSKSPSQPKNNFDVASSQSVNSPFSQTMYYPERPPPSVQEQQIYAKTREHLRFLSSKNEQKKQEEIERKVWEQYDADKKKRIRDQVLDKLKSKNKPSKKEEDKKEQLFTPLQEDMHSRLVNALHKIDSLNQNNNDMKHDVEHCVKDLEELEKKKKSENPGLAVNQMLQKMADEPVYTAEDLRNYASELWLTAEKFEEQLKQEQYGMKLELELRKEQFQTRVDGIRAATSLRIEALETALIETKLKYQKERERAEMRLSEMESQLLNRKRSEEQIDKTLGEAIQKILEIPQSQGSIGEIRESAREINLKGLIRQLHGTVRSLQGDKKELEKEIKEHTSELDKNTSFQNEVNEEFKKSKEMVLYYQIILYEVLKTTKLFDEEGSASQDDKIMFKEIKELNQERIRFDKNDQANMTKYDPKRALNRLSTYVDEVHDILTTLDIRQIMKNYLTSVDEKVQDVGDLVIELANIKLIPPSQIPSDYEPSSPALSRASSFRSQTGKFTRMPMINVNDETRDRIESKITSLTSRISDAINLKLEQKREEMQNISNLPGVTELRSEDEDDKQEDQELQEFGIQSEKGGISEDNRSEYMQKMKLKQLKRANDAEKRERAASAKKQRQERLEEQQRIQKENEEQKVQKKKKVKEKQKNAATNNGNKEAKSKSQAKEKKSKSPQKKKKEKNSPSPEPNEKTIADKDKKQSSMSIKTRQNTSILSDNDLKQETEQKQVESRDQQKSLKEQDKHFESGQLAMTEPLDPAGNFFEDIKGKLNDRYRDQFKRYKNISQHFFKLNESQFEGLWQSFKNSIGCELTSSDYMRLFESSMFEDFMNQVNEIQKKHLRTQEGEPEEILLGDCIQADIDNEGNFNGFLLRTDMCKLIMCRVEGQLNQVHKLIKHVNYMNRLLLQGKKDYILGQKKVTAERAEFGCQVDTFEPVVVEKQVEVPVEVQKKESETEDEEEFQTITVKLTPEVKQIIDRMRDHVVDVLMREKPSQKSYYKLVWDKQTFEQLVEYRLPNVFDEIPEGGFETESDRPQEITVSEYFEHLFQNLREKLEGYISDKHKTDLSIKNLVWCGHEIKDEEEELNSEREKLQEKKQNEARQAQNIELQSKLEQVQTQSKGINDKLQTQLQDSQKEAETLQRRLTQMIEKVLGELTSTESQTPEAWNRDRNPLIDKKQIVSPYSLRSLQNKATIKKNVEIQTGKELLHSLLKGEIVNEEGVITQIDEAMAKEMQRTVEAIESYYNLLIKKQKIDEQAKADNLLNKGMELFNQVTEKYKASAGVDGTLSRNHSNARQVRSRLQNIREDIEEAANLVKIEITTPKAPKLQTQDQSHPPAPYDRKNQVKRAARIGQKLPSINVDNFSTTMESTELDGMDSELAKTSRFKELKQQSMNLEGRLVSKRGSVPSQTARVGQNPFKQVNMKSIDPGLQNISELYNSSKSKFAPVRNRSGRAISLRNPPGLDASKISIQNKMVNDPSGDIESSMNNSKEFLPNPYKKRNQSFFVSESPESIETLANMGYSRNNISHQGKPFQTSQHSYYPNGASMRSDLFIKQIHIQSQKANNEAKAFIRVQNPKALQVLSNSNVQDIEESSNKYSSEIFQQKFFSQMDSQQPMQTARGLINVDRLTPDLVPIESSGSPLSPKEGTAPHTRKASKTMLF